MNGICQQSVLWYTGASAKTLQNSKCVACNGGDSLKEVVFHLVLALCHLRSIMEVSLIGVPIPGMVTAICASITHLRYCSSTFVSFCASGSLRAFTHYNQRLQGIVRNEHIGLLWNGISRKFRVASSFRSRSSTAVFGTCCWSNVQTKKSSASKRMMDGSPE